jgi:hypothetical protein
MDDADHIAALRAAGDEMFEARERANRARDKAREVALAAMAAGLGEAPVARFVGVDRMTLRRWQGKQ